MENWPKGGKGKRNIPKKFMRLSNVLPFSYKEVSIELSPNMLCLTSPCSWRVKKIHPLPVFQVSWLRFFALFMENFLIQLQ